MTPFTFIIKRKAYALAAFVALTCAGLVSCTDDNLVNNNGGSESVNPADFKLATTTVTFSANAGMQLPNITRAMDPDAPATRAVSVNDRYMPLAEDGSNLKARVFVVKADPNSMKMINGKKAMDPDKVIMGAGEVSWNKIQQIAGGGVSLRSDANLLYLTWLDKSVLIKPGEDWYICGIIGGEYDKSAENAANTETNLEKKKLYNQLYHFYVKMNPSNDHNTRDAKGNLRVTAAFSTGWTKLTVKKTNQIDLRNWAFKAMGTLIRFKVKRDPTLVKPEAHKYTFASSQLTANGGFMMMPLSLFTKDPDYYKMDCDKGLDCEIRPWEQDIDHNFYWQYESDKRLHFNNVTNTKPSEEKATEYGTPIYEYRYTYDASTMRDGKANNDYDEFYVWGMPIPLPNYNGTTQLTAERGSFMLGRKQPKGSKYDYADEWLFAKAVDNKTNSNEYKLIDFAQKRGMGFTAEVGVCRPRFSTMEGDKLKYAWPNPLERLAVTNSMTNEKGWHETNTQHSSGDGYGNVSNWSLKQADFKMNFVVGDKKCLPDNYHAPNSEEWGAVIPNIYKNITDRYLESNLLGWDYITPGSWPWYEMYNYGEDDMRPIITGGETHNANKTPILEELYWHDYAALYSYFMQDREMGEMFAIRFVGTHEGAKHSNDQYLLGNRYRCAYRWRFVNMGGPAGSNDDTGYMRLVVQSRWIGSANVTLRDLKDEKWWGESSPKNPLFETDCYRVLPCVGYPYTGSGRTWYVSYWSRTRWKAVNGEDNYYSNKTFCFRRIGKDGFERGHNDALKYYLPVRLFVNRDVDEFGNEAPRKKQHDNDQTLLISRMADNNVTDWTWTPKY